MSALPRYQLNSKSSCRALLTQLPARCLKKGAVIEIVRWLKKKNGDRISPTPGSPAAVVWWPSHLVGDKSHLRWQFYARESMCASALHAGVGETEDCEIGCLWFPLLVLWKLPDVILRSPCSLPWHPVSLFCHVCFVLCPHPIFLLTLFVFQAMDYKIGRGGEGGGEGGGRPVTGSSTNVVWVTVYLIIHLFHLFFFLSPPHPPPPPPVYSTVYAPQTLFPKRRVVVRPPRERQTWVQSPLSPMSFLPGRVIPVT